MRSAFECARVTADACMHERLQLTWKLAVGCDFQHTKEETSELISTEAAAFSSCK